MQNTQADTARTPDLTVIVRANCLPESALAGVADLIMGRLFALQLLAIFSSVIGYGLSLM